MKLIRFKGKKYYTTTEVENKTNICDFVKDYKTATDIINSGKKKIINHYDEYWIPADKINKLCVESGKYYVNGIEVDEIEFYAVYGMLEFDDNAAIAKCFAERNFEVVNNKVKLNYKEEKENAK